MSWWWIFDFWQKSRRSLDKYLNSIKHEQFDFVCEVWTIALRCFNISRVWNSFDKKYDQVFLLRSLMNVKLYLLPFCEVFGPAHIILDEFQCVHCCNAPRLKRNDCGNACQLCMRSNFLDVRYFENTMNQVAATDVVYGLISSVSHSSRCQKSISVDEILLFCFVGRLEEWPLSEQKGFKIYFVTITTSCGSAG